MTPNTPVLDTIVFAIGGIGITPYMTVSTGPQVGWSTVFIAEYTGPIFAYLIFYFALYNSGKEIQCVQT